jgi:hypothetical protein
MDHPEALHLTDKHPHCYVHYPRPILYPLPHNCLRAPLCNVPYPSPCTCDPVPKDLCSSNITFFFTVRSKSHHLTCSSMKITQQQPMECCPLIQPGRRGEGRHGMLLTFDLCECYTPGRVTRLYFTPSPYRLWSAVPFQPDSNNPTL